MQSCRSFSSSARFFQLQLVKPNDPAYFTGNSHYFGYLKNLNFFIKKYDVHIHQNTTGNGQDALEGTGLHSTPKWLSKSAMVNDLSLRLTDDNYNDLINRLNTLYPIQEQEVKDLLQQFIPIGKSLDRAPPEIPKLDEFNRSFTLASRKTSRARVYLIPGIGQIYVNGKSMSQYFPQLFWRESIIKPFEVTETLGKFNVWAITHGGGLTGQAEAIQTAVARGIEVHDPPKREQLMQHDLLTIDRRQVERKKTGQPKARKKNTWVKR